MLRVEELEATLPSMTQWRATVRRSVDWAALEADLGTALPSDYRSLADAYPVLVIDDFLTVSVPTPGAEVRWASASRGTKSFRICTRWATPRATFPSRSREA